MIACVLRSGGNYRPEHVQRMASQARTFAPGEAIVCLTDVLVPGVATVPLAYRWPGWWSKLELFRPGAFPDGERVLYLDLDTTLLGPLDGLLARTEPFLALADFYRRPPVVPERGLGSGLLMWTAGEQGALYEDFASAPESHMGRHGYGGDQRFIEARKLAGTTFWEDVVPGQVVSYKVHCQAHRVPAGACVVCFHGRPKPWDLPELTVPLEATCQAS